MGYDKESDNTWEDEDNCVGSQQLVDVYWEEHGGKPAIASAQKKGSARKRNLSTPVSEGGATKRRRQSTGEEDSPVRQKTNGVASWKPPADLENWDDKVTGVETVERMDNGLILVYLNWYSSLRNRSDYPGKMGNDRPTIVR
jgi:chromobox protein 1